MKKSEPSRRQPISPLPSSIDDIGSRDQGNLAKNYNRAQRGAQVKSKQAEIRFGETWFGKLLQSPMARWLIRDGKFSWDLLLVTVVGVGILIAVVFPYLKRGFFSDNQVEASKLSRPMLFHNPDDAASIIQAFYAADSIEKQLQLVRSPELVEPLIRSFYKNGFRRPEPNEYEETTPATILEHYGRNFSVTGFTFL